MSTSVPKPVPIEAIKKRNNARAIAGWVTAGFILSAAASIVGGAVSQVYKTQYPRLTDAAGVFMLVGSAFVIFIGSFVNIRTLWDVFNLIANRVDVYPYDTTSAKTLMEDLASYTSRIVINSSNNSNKNPPKGGQVDG